MTIFNIQSNNITIKKGYRMAVNVRGVNIDYDMKVNRDGKWEIGLKTNPRKSYVQELNRKELNKITIKVEHNGNVYDGNREALTNMSTILSLASSKYIIAKHMGLSDEEAYKSSYGFELPYRNIKGEWVILTPKDIAEIAEKAMLKLKNAINNN